MSNIYEILLFKTILLSLSAVPYCGLMHYTNSYSLQLPHFLFSTVSVYEILFETKSELSSISSMSFFVIPSSRRASRSHLPAIALPSV